VTERPTKQLLSGQAKFTGVVSLLSCRGRITDKKKKSPCALTSSASSSPRAVAISASLGASPPPRPDANSPPCAASSPTGRAARWPRPCAPPPGQPRRLRPLRLGRCLDLPLRRLRRWPPTWQGPCPLRPPLRRQCHLTPSTPRFDIYLPLFCLLDLWSIEQSGPRIGERIYRCLLGMLRSVCSGFMCLKWSWDHGVYWII
jgi:hypothetical protein